MKERLPLTATDIRKLRKNLFGIVAFPFLAAGLFYGFFSLFFANSSFFHDTTSRYILIGFSLFLFFIIAYMLSVFVIDLRRGYKFRIEGIITDKKQTVHTSRTTTNRSGSSRSSTTRHFYVSIDDIQYPIEQYHYHKLQVGSLVVLEKAPKSNLTLLIELPPQLALTPTRKQILPKLEKTDFGPEDFIALKRGIRATVKSRLFWLLPTLLIVLSLIWNGMQVFLVFLFPLVLIPAYQAWKIIQAIKQYKSNKQYAYKEAIQAVIEDKSKYTHNGTISNNILTSQGRLKVDHVVYEKLKVGDELLLFKPAKGKQVLSILTANNEEIYLV